MNQLFLPPFLNTDGEIITFIWCNVGLRSLTSMSGNPGEKHVRMPVFIIP